MNEKILYQLIDAVRGYSPVTYEVAQSLILQLLCWWRLSKEGRIPESVRFEPWAFEPFPQLLEVIREAQSSLPYPFIDEDVWQSLRQLNDLRPIVEKIRQLESQGFLTALDLQDVAFWLCSKPGMDVPSVSPDLADLMVGLATLSKDQTVYTPWEFSGQIASRVVRTQALTWVESQNAALLSPILCSSAQSGWTLHVTDPVEEPSALEKGQLKRFDCAICFPPGRRYSNEVIERDLLGRFIEKTPVGSVLQIRHLLAQVKGKIVIGMNNSLLFGAGSERQLREHLVNSGLIESVISLPSLLGRSTTSINVLVLNTTTSTKNVRFVKADIDEYRLLNTKRRTDLSNKLISPNQLSELIKLIESSEQTEAAVTVTSEIIAENDFSLDVSRYILNDEARKLSDVLKRYPFARLGDFFEIIRPRQHATSLSGVEVFEVQTLDMPPFGYLTTAGKPALFDLGSPKASTYFLRENDVLLTFRGTIGRVTVAQETPGSGNGGWIAGQSLVILRGMQTYKYSPEVLAIYLRSETGQALLNRIAVGAGMLSLQISALKELEIPVLSVEEMDKMTQAFKHEAQIQIEIQHLRDKQTALAAGFWHL
jgi:type I restriction enzyme M protein